MAHTSSGLERDADKAILLTPPILFSIERAIEYIDNDELVEVTPNHLRFRKRILDANDTESGRPVTRHPTLHHPLDELAMRGWLLIARAVGRATAQRLVRRHGAFAAQRAQLPVRAEA